MNALKYHSQSPAGKISVQPTKPCFTQIDLALAYTPGVAEPVKAIMQQPANAYTYTNKGNLVGVITNGTATLGLGNTGALASKPVMEGKSVLFKRFAGIDAYDLELTTTDPEKFVDTVEQLAPTFGGINLEDIAAPACFYIETELQKRLDIPVFHDDQHGTAIISGAALLNALEIVGKKIQNVKIVVCGAGAAGIRCAQHYIRLGASRSNLYLVDSKGVVTSDRKNVTGFKKELAQNVPAQSLADILKNADVFLGVSTANILTPAMLKTMAPKPIVFALANPDPEIKFALAQRTRPDGIIASGRSDCANQINNVLGFPFVFRGALDVRAKVITPNMYVAATRALAKLAHEAVPKAVLKAYNLKQLKFGPDYIVPKPFDARLLVEVSSAVAQAAMKDGVARKKVVLKKYRVELKHRLH